MISAGWGEINRRHCRNPLLSCDSLDRPCDLRQLAGTEEEHQSRSMHHSTDHPAYCGRLARARTLGHYYCHHEQDAALATPEHLRYRPQERPPQTSQAHSLAWRCCTDRVEDRVLWDRFLKGCPFHAEQAQRSAPAPHPQDEVSGEELGRVRCGSSASRQSDVMGHVRST